MKTHPKLPPNCPHFAKVKPFGVVFYYENPKSSNAAFWILVTMETEFARRIVACVAVEYWELFADQLLSSTDPTDKRQVDAYYKKVEDAAIQRDAWRKWGGLA